jgi:innexin
MGKCTYRNFGPSGTSQIIDAICLLNHNAVNEKIYIFLFVLFFLLTFISGLVILYRLAVICIRPLRTLLLKGQTPLTPSKDVETVSKNFHPDDWFVLRMLGRNINPAAFNELVSDLAAKLTNLDGIVSGGHQSKFNRWFNRQPS